MKNMIWNSPHSLNYVQYKLEQAVKLKRRKELSRQYCLIR